MSNDYLKGLSSVQEEYVVHRLNLSGKDPLPGWLKGRYIRNGPALFDVKSYKLRHLFDGMAMLYKFEFADGKIWYTNRFLQSDAYTKAIKNGELAYREFATEPHRSWLDFIIGTLFPKYSDNASINITRVAGKYLALNEAMRQVEFRLDTLDTAGHFAWPDTLKGDTTSAHPLYDSSRKTLFNFATDYALASSYYLYGIKDGSRHRDILARIRVKDPGYMHAFAMTENYLILVEFPLRIGSLINLILNYQQPFLKDFKWQPQEDTRFLVVRKSDGALVLTAQSEPFMSWHHVNAYEVGDDIFVDTCAYPDSSQYQFVYFDRLLQPGGAKVPPMQFKRYHLRLGLSTVTGETICDQQFDLPRINYDQSIGKFYRFTYGVGPHLDYPNDYSNRLVKVNTQTGDSWIWYQEGCYPGEPLFVGRPGAEAEDDGVVLSVIVDGKHEKGFLLILDGQSFQEIARAELPHITPYGLHGMFYSE